MSPFLRSLYSSKSKELILFRGSDFKLKEMSFSTLKLIPPTLDAKDRTSAEDLLAFITFEHKMEPFLRD